MYSLLQQLPFRSVLFELIPTFAISLFIAEMFYKFHSFTLECIAFLVTWYVIDGAYRVISERLTSRRSGQSSHDLR